MDSAILKGTKVDGKVGVAPLPHGPGGQVFGDYRRLAGRGEQVQQASRCGASVGEVLCQQAGPGVARGQCRIVPTMTSVASVKPSRRTALPGTVGNHTQRVVRPSTVLKGNYAKGSTDIYQTVNSILTGSSVSSAVSTLQSELSSLHSLIR